MTRDVDALSRWIEAPVPLVICWITNENTRKGTRRKFVRGRGGGIGKTKASKNPKMIVRGRCAEQELVRCGRDGFLCRGSSAAW